MNCKRIISAMTAVSLAAGPVKIMWFNNMKNILPLAEAAEIK